MNFIYVTFPVCRGDFTAWKLTGVRGGNSNGVAQLVTVRGINLRTFSRKVQQFVGTVCVQPNLRKRMVLCDVKSIVVELCSYCM